MNIKADIDSIVNYLLIVFVVFLALPLRTGFTSGALIAISVFAFFMLIFGKYKFSFNLTIGYVALPFLVYALGLINTSNIEYGLKFVTGNLSFLLWPFIFIVFSTVKINTIRIFKAFIISMLIPAGYLVYLIVYYYNFGTQFYKLVTIEIFHTTYLGLYLLTASMFGFFIWRKEKNKLFLASSFFFLACAFLCSSRVIIIIGFLLVLIYLYMVFKNKVLFFSSTLLVCAVLVLAIYNSPSLNEKFLQFTELQQLGFDKDNYDSLSSRFGKIEAASRTISRYPLFGTGTGDFYDELLVEYEEMDFTMGFKHRYNPHNQYLDNIVRNGFVGGGVALLCLYLIPLWISLKRKIFELFGFMFIIGIVSLTESILDVHRGIMFYTFFTVLILSTVKGKINDVN